MIKLLIADDHQIIIDGLLQILEGNKRYKVVATANSGSEVLDILEKETIDIAILDIEMPPPDGVELTRIICEQYPKIYVLILTMYNREAFVSEIMAIGSKRYPNAPALLSTPKDFGIGFILKNKGKEELTDALDAISEGKNYYGKEVMDTILSSWTHQQAKPQKEEKEKLSLTRREKEVLKLIAAGKSTPKIAAALFIANSTVETHRRNLISKCGVDNSKELMVFAIKNGLD